MNLKQTVIRLDHVSYRFRNGIDALSDVSLRVDAGEIVAVVGPSGCGKSTLLNLISGLVQPSSGTIVVDGKPMRDRLGRFGYMPQKDLLLPWRSAQDNAALLLEVQGLRRSAARAQACAMLEQFGLGQFAAMSPAGLSGGMRQRVALIRTFLPAKDVLLDEPFGALDAITRSELQEWLMHIQATTDLSAVLVTHDVEEAVLLASRVYVMSPRPGTITAEIDIPLDRPRSPMAVTSLDFTALRSRVLSELRRAMTEVYA